MQVSEQTYFWDKPTQAKAYGVVIAAVTVLALGILTTGFLNHFHMIDLCAHTALNWGQIGAGFVLLIGAAAGAGGVVWWVMQKPQLKEFLEAFNAARAGQATGSPTVFYVDKSVNDEIIRQEIRIPQDGRKFTWSTTAHPRPTTLAGKTFYGTTGLYQTVKIT